MSKGKHTGLDLSDLDLPEITTSQPVIDSTVKDLIDEEVNKSKAKEENKEGAKEGEANKENKENTENHTIQSLPINPENIEFPTVQFVFNRIMHISLTRI